MSQPRWGFFVGTVVTRWLDDDSRLMVLEQPLSYVRPSGQRYTARAGLRFDGASIPRAFWRVIGSPFTGRYRRAAIIHDQLCADGRLGIAPVDSATTHRIFYEGIRCDGGSALLAWTMWAAVRVGGPRFAAGALEAAA